MDVIELSQTCENPHQTEAKAILKRISNEAPGAADGIACGTGDILVADHLKNKNMLDNDNQRIAIESARKEGEEMEERRKRFEEYVYKGTYCNLKSL